MKKIAAIITSLIMIMGLVACGSSEPSHTLSFVEGKTVMVDEQEYIAVFCDYTNNSGETCLPCDGINVKAFQNGKELTVIVYTGQKTEGAIQCDTSVQTGTTARVVWLFEGQDDSEVSVETTDGQKFSFTLE